MDDFQVRTVFFVRDTPARSASRRTGSTRSRGIKPVYTHWGEPTLAILDPDGNELFFWLSDAGRARLRAAHEGTG
jgi:hypothetical protein